MKTPNQITHEYRTIVGLSFNSAHALRDLLTPAARRVIRQQPGYRTGAEMCIGRTQTGAHRLYVRIDGQWMDASLQDLPLAIE
jgi:hypothetical protein